MSELKDMSVVTVEQVYRFRKKALEIESQLRHSETMLEKTLSELKIMKGRVETLRNQKPKYWEYEWFGCMNELTSEETWNPDILTYKPEETEFLKVIGPLYTKSEL